MCDPLTIGGAALATGGSAVSAYGTYQAQKAQYGFQKSLYAQTREMAAQDAQASYGALGDQLQQATAATGLEVDQAAMDTAAAAGATRAAQAAAGVQGVSAADAQQVLQARLTEDVAVRQRNLSNTRVQILRDMDAVRRQQRARELSALPGPKPEFNWFQVISGAMGAAGSAVSAGAFSSGSSSK